jgi:predicted RNA binding protein YcfA (HicA-like mRNA interferase family)
MPKKVRELIKIVEDHGFVNRGGKGSHRNFLHPSGVKITISGNAGDDAKPYQEREVKKVIKEVQENEGKR